MAKSEAKKAADAKVAETKRAAPKGAKAKAAAEAEEKADAESKAAAEAQAASKSKAAAEAEAKASRLCLGRCPPPPPPPPYFSSSLQDFASAPSKTSTQLFCSGGEAEFVIKLQILTNMEEGELKKKGGFKGKLRKPKFTRKVKTGAQQKLSSVVISLLLHP